MNNMFSECSSLSSIMLSNLDANNMRESDYIYMNNMFSNCSSLTLVTFDNIKLSKGELNLNGTFYGCKSLRYIKITNFPYSLISNYYEIFNDIPNNIIFCIDNRQSSLYDILSGKICSLFNCNNNWQENQIDKIIYNNNTCIKNCESLFDYINICYAYCPRRTYPDNYICKDAKIVILHANHVINQEQIIFIIVFLVEQDII